MSVVSKLVYPVAVMAIVIAVSITFAAHVGAVGFDRSMADGAASARGADQVTDLFGQAGVFRNITNVMLFIIGAVSVIMLIIGGLRYVVSGGDSTAVQNAKNTILYAIVGVIVALLAYAVVSFVISSFSGASGVGGVSATNV